MDPKLDPDILKAIARGDETACSQVFRQFESQVYTLAFRICQSEADALDVLQDTFIAAFERISQFRGDYFGAWIKKIAVNQALTRIRKQRRGPLLTALDSARQVAAASPAAGVEMDLNQAFSRLAPLPRTVVWLYDVEGFSHQEIADQFGKSLSFSKTQLSRAHRQMRAWLDETRKESTCLSNHPA